MIMMTKKSLFSLMNFIFLLTILKPVTPLGLIQNTCKKTPNYQLCISTLGSDPRSSKADVAGLGLIIVDAIKAKTIHAINTIKVLKRSHPELKQPLGECSGTYGAVLSADIPEAIEALTKGNPKFAEDGMNNAASVAQRCENGFGHFKSPMKDANKGVHDLSLVAVSIIRTLL